MPTWLRKMSTASHMNWRLPVAEVQQVKIYIIGPVIQEDKEPVLEQSDPSGQVAKRKPPETTVENSPSRLVANIGTLLRAQKTADYRDLSTCEDDAEVGRDEEASTAECDNGCCCRSILSGCEKEAYKDVGIGRSV